MAETQSTQTATSVAVTASPAVQVDSTKLADTDIISKAAAFKPPAEPSTNGNGSNPTKDFNEHLSKVQDPVARKLLEDVQKSMQADYTKKTQDLASKSKEIDSLRTSLEQSKQFTPARIQELLSDPTFVQAAQGYIATQQPVQSNGQIATGDLTPEEISYLAPEQQKLYAKQMEQAKILSSLQGELISQKAQKEDVELSTRYPNYDPGEVEKTWRAFSDGNIRATREHFYKILKHDENVKQAYAMGREHERNGIRERIDASSTTGGLNAVNIQAEMPARQPNESSQAFWKRCAQQAKLALGSPKT